jgi:excisionase family DNA binding protein
LANGSPNESFPGKPFEIRQRSDYTEWLVQSTDLGTVGATYQCWKSSVPLAQSSETSHKTVAHQPFKGIHIELDELMRTMEEEEKQVETSPTLERKRAKYTVEDVRQLCGGISRSTVMREIRRKRLACYRARRTLRFSEEHITKYLERVEQGVK